MRSTLVLLTAGVLLATLCSGCQKFTRQRFDTVYIGQPASDVQVTLGKPTVSLDGQWSYINHSPFYKANIYFNKDGKVADKRWFDEKELSDMPMRDQLKGDSPACAAPADQPVEVP